jgi:hypothetical protein
MKSNGSDKDKHRIRELESQIQKLENEIKALKIMINEKNVLVDEKNKTIEFLSNQNNKSNNSQELFDRRFTEMESKV